MNSKFHATTRKAFYSLKSIDFAEWNSQNVRIIVLFGKNSVTLLVKTDYMTLTINSMKNTVGILALLLLALASAKGQNSLTISGEVVAEKMDAETIKILVIEVNNKVYDTIQIINLYHKKYRNRADFNITLKLDKQYKLSFATDTSYQQTLYIDVSTKASDSVLKNYFTKDVSPFIRLIPGLKKNGDIYFDSKTKKFIFSEIH